MLDLFSIMKYRCGDPMFDEDYARLDALRPEESWPRRPEPPMIADLPAYAWNRRDLAEQLGLTSSGLEDVIGLPGCPTRKANGRWPTREIAHFMVDVIEGRIALDKVNK